MEAGTSQLGRDSAMTNRTLRGRRSISLGTRFLVAFVAVAVLPLVAVAGFQIASSYSVQRTQVQELQSEAARTAANTIDAYLAQIEDEMTLTAREWTLRSAEARPALIDGLLAYNDGFETITIMDVTGRETVKTSRYTLYGAQDLVSQAEMPEFLIPMAGERYLGPISVSQYGEPLVTLSIPVKGTIGQTTGVLSAQVNLKYMWDIIAQMEIGRGGYAYVVDEGGQLIAHRDSSLVLQGRDLSNLQGVRTALQSKELSATYVGLNRQNAIGRYQALQQAPWFVFVEAPAREAMGDIYRSAIASAAAVAVALLVAALLGWYTTRAVVGPVRRLQEGASLIGSGNLAHRIDIQSRDEMGALASAFNGMASQLQELIGTLELRVAERTRGLEAAAEVSRSVTSVLDPDHLPHQVVEMIRERFDLYYVGLFLVDESQQFAVLRSGTGEAGQQMLARGHRLDVGGDSMIGQCVAGGEARIALDVGDEAVRFNNPLLPKTHSEMALPLRSRGRIIGAMTVQSSVVAAFDEADIAVMQTMADQVAAAIDNAQLFNEAQRALEEMESTHRRYQSRAWAEYTQARAIQGYQYTKTGVVPLDADAIAHVPGAVAAQYPDSREGSGNTGRHADSSVPPALVAPITLRGQPIGVLGIQPPGDGRSWSDEDVALAEAVAEQFAQAADNLRLLDETQRSAARTRRTSEVAARMRETLDVELVLRTAVDEIYQTLGLSEVLVRLVTEEEDGGQPSGKGNDDDYLG